jgi:hypothetical protein
MINDCQLAYWVAMAENLTPSLNQFLCITREETPGATPVVDENDSMGFSYSPQKIWDQGGPLIEKYGVSIYPYIDGHGWYAHAQNGRGTRMDGDSPLVAAMRSIVATKYGKDISFSRTLSFPKTHQVERISHFSR